MTEDDIIEVILQEHDGDVGKMLMTLLTLVPPEVEIERVSHLDDAREVARCLLTCRRSAGLRQCDPDLHSRLILSRYQSVPPPEGAPDREGWTEGLPPEIFEPTADEAIKRR